jgi:hypothetical protein
MFGRKIIISVVCAFSVQFAEANESRLNRESMPIKHTLFEQWQGNFAAAYRVAEYYKQRGSDAPELKLAQAAASLELGYLAHGRELINDLDARSLLPENQSRLHLYLARDAYRRRDWILLDEHLNALTAFSPESNHFFFLKAESARNAGRINDAEQALSQLESDDGLRFFGLFNLAVVVADDHEAATRLLSELIDRTPLDYEQRMLSERARIALADLYVKTEQRELARRVLAEVTASEQYGPLALARLAQLDMQDERYENAAAIWYYLAQHYPWHRAATAAPSGLGYALLQSKSEEAAYGAYLDALTRITNQQSHLGQFRKTLSIKMQDSNWMLDPDGSNESLLEWLSKGLGHDDWTTWLSDESVRHTARRWQSLNNAYAMLQVRQIDLAILLDVDAEQGSRIRSAREAVSNQGLDQSTKRLRNSISKELAALREQSLTIDDSLDRFATAEQLAVLDELSHLQQSAAASRYQARLNRLIGTVRYNIYESLPVRKQQQIAQLEQQLADVAIAEDRIGRIHLAANRLVATDGVSNQISVLAAETTMLSVRTGDALAGARASLIAGLGEFIDRDEALLANQVHGLQYDITRLVDRQVAGVQK